MEQEQNPQNQPIQNPTNMVLNKLNGNLNKDNLRLNIDTTATNKINILDRITDKQKEKVIIKG